MSKDCRQIARLLDHDLIKVVITVGSEAAIGLAAEGNRVRRLKGGRAGVYGFLGPYLSGG